MKLIHNPEVSQINYLDQRFYTNNGGETYFPSVTEILDVYPKGFGFNQWLKDVGSNASEIANRAALQGTNVHEATESLHKGQAITWVDENGKANYTLKEWEMLLKYQQFWLKVKPELIANEMALCSSTLKFGGTLDRVVIIAGKRWLLDIKTSNYLHNSYELQLAAYAMLFNELNPENPIEETGILWLNASTKTEKINAELNIYQGNGWQIKTYGRHYMDAFRIFQHVQAIWQEENPIYKPLNKIMPDRIIL